ncbi:MAG: sulfite exporter TauE/SafE family protein [Bowdeniella nasicola]|nr:sulfite exporter TauE/SafE family protein [Bowdeniella nasicola]
MALVVGLGVGLIVGALGAGGGILSVPILVYLLGQAPHDAAAASLIIVGVTALVALPSHARAGHVKWKDGLVFGALSVVGSVAGGLLSRFVSEPLLMSLFALLLCAVGFAMAQRARTTWHDDAEAEDGADTDGHANPDAPTVSRRPTGSRWRIFSRDAHHPSGPVLLSVAASLTGFLTGFFGVGGGFAVVPMLVLVLSFGMKQASGTSLLVMVIASLAGLASRYGADIHLDWPLIALFTAGSALGGMAGGPLTRSVRPALLTAAFALLLFAVSLATGVQAIPELFA